MADNNIIFIGMPAVGKSTVGVVIAKRLGYRFVDTDILIQESEGKLLKDIIADVGPDGFLKVEDRVNAQVKEMCIRDRSKSFPSTYEAFESSPIFEEDENYKALYHQLSKYGHPRSKTPVYLSLIHISSVRTSYIRIPSMRLTLTHRFVSSI